MANAVSIMITTTSEKRIRLRFRNIVKKVHLLLTLIFLRSFNCHGDYRSAIGVRYHGNISCYIEIKHKYAIELFELEQMKNRFCLASSFAVVVVALLVPATVQWNASNGSLLSQKDQTVESVSAYSISHPNQNLQVQYIVVLNSGNTTETELVQSTVSLSEHGADYVDIASSMSNGISVQTINATYALSDFQSMDNLRSYSSFTTYPDPTQNGNFSTWENGSATNHLVTYLQTTNKNPTYNFSSFLVIHMIQTKGKQSLFINLNFNASAAYLFIPQLLPPNSDQPIQVSQNSQEPSFATSPLSVTPPPGGGGGGSYSVFAEGTMHIHDVPIYPNYPLWDASGALSTYWTSDGGSFVYASGGGIYTIDRFDWCFLSQGSSSSSSSNSYTYTYLLTMFANFPYSGFSEWESYAAIQITEKNDGSVNVQMLNLLYVWTGAFWVLWCDVPNTDQNGGNGATFSVTAWILVGTQY